MITAHSNHQHVASLRPRLIDMLAVEVNRHVFGSKPSLPKQIGEYRLLKPTLRTNESINCATGLYRKGNKEFFLKIWHGALHDHNATLLAHEYDMTSALYESPIKGIHVVRPMELIDNGTTLVAVYQYIDAKPLTTFPIAKQAEVIAHTLKAMESSRVPSISRTTIHDYKNNLKRLVLLAIARNPNDFGVLYHFYNETLRSLSSMRSNSLALAHRDLMPDNILVSGNKIYVLDWEDPAITIAGYDLAHFFAAPGYEKVAGIIAKNLQTKPDAFLLRYILMRNVAFCGDEQIHNTLMEKVHDLDKK
jgi:thiamine kinase-like enzyme